MPRHRSVATLFVSASLLAGSAALVACGGDDDAPAIDAGVVIIADASPADAAPPPDAMPPPPDAATEPLGPALGAHQIELTGVSGFFSLIGSAFVNDQVQMMIDNGGLLIALELRNLDDPAGQDDDAIEVGFYQCTDPDFDASDNFDAENPDRWIASGASLDINGDPQVVFANGTLIGGELYAVAIGEITVPGPFPLPVVDPEIRGTLVASPDNDAVFYIENATIVGAVPAATLGQTPNIAAGMCPGNNLLDVLVNGCGFIGSQPDADLDGDGLERFFDDSGPDEGDAGPGEPDGVVDRCVDGPDGDGGEVSGTDCWMDEAFADGYLVELTVQGTRIVLLREVL